MAAGLVALIAAVALMHFVMGFSLAVIPAITALFWLPTALRSARSTDCEGSAVYGLIYLLAAFCFIIVAAFSACSIAHEISLDGRGSDAPRHIWTLLASPLTWTIGAALTWKGLRQWTNWSSARRMGWTVIAFCLPPGAFIAHQIFKALGAPTTA